jgi:hypothetical protein
MSEYGGDTTTVVPVVTVCALGGTTSKSERRRKVQTEQRRHVALKRKIFVRHIVEYATTKLPLVPYSSCSSRSKSPLVPCAVLFQAEVATCARLVLLITVQGAACVGLRVVAATWWYASKSGIPQGRVATGQTLILLFATGSPFHLQWQASAFSSTRARRRR